MAAAAALAKLTRQGRAGRGRGRAALLIEPSRGARLPPAPLGRARGRAAADNGGGKRRAGDGGRARAEAQGPGVERAASCCRVARVQSPWRRCWPPAADALEALTEVCPA